MSGKGAGLLKASVRFRHGSVLWFGLSMSGTREQSSFAGTKTKKSRIKINFFIPVQNGS
jgi:hypothetical protein